MSYILKGCGPAGGLQSFVQQCIFNGASHEQEPYGPREDRKAEEEGQSGGAWVRGEGWGGWWNGEGRGVWKERKKGGEGGAGETGCEWLVFMLFVAPQWCFLQDHWVPGEETTFRAQTVPRLVVHHFNMPVF